MAKLIISQEDSPRKADTANAEAKLQLNETLFRSEHRIFEIVDTEFDDDFHDWKLVPLVGNTLAGEHTLSGLTDGNFILAAMLVRADGPIEPAYVSVGLPERDIDWHFLMRDGEIERGIGTLIQNGQIIPAVAIEKFGGYEQYYVPGHAEAGIKVLVDGLACAKQKSSVALDLAYIFRDEKRYAEAIEYFTLGIEGAVKIKKSDYFLFAERAMLFAKVGDVAAADRDWTEVERLAGADVLKYMRGA